MAELHSPGSHLLKPKWEDLHSDPTVTASVTVAPASATFCRQSNISASENAVAGYLVPIPNLSPSCCTTAEGNHSNTHEHVSSSSLCDPSSVFKQEQECLLVELQKERQKNAELLGRLSTLEARLQEKQKEKASTYTVEQENFKKYKKPRKVDNAGELDEVENKRVLDKTLTVKDENLHAAIATRASQDSIVNWMSQDELQLPELDTLKNSASDRDGEDESDDTDDESENADCGDEEVDEFEESKAIGNTRNTATGEREGDGFGNHAHNSNCEVTDDGQSSNTKYEVKEELEVSAQTVTDCHMEDGENEKINKCLKRRRIKIKYEKSDKVMYNERSPNNGGGQSNNPGVTSSLKKAPKMAFCPKEVRRIMESGVLALKNAQSHTMRKIIVFASLGIRHGCEDMYDLDFNNFTIVKKGEPYKSSDEPGEHVIYEQPGVRRKVFYPNRQNPVLCPVCILEEEKAMRPSDPSCPSCLFLCIKYGGRTRNLPQNEYVRQRMGRNKLKSFGPLMCQMAFLVHVRTGSFFFKALGITLLFMAGFTDDLVRKETKYCNLDLLQKYYRSDEDAEGEELFHSYPMFYPLQQAMTTSSSMPAKGVLASGKPPGKRHPTPFLGKPSTSHGTRCNLTVSTRPMSSAQFAPSNFHHSFSPAGATFLGASPHVQTMSITSTSGMVTGISSTNGPFSSFPRRCTLYPPYAARSPSNTYLAMPPWHPVNSFVPNNFPNPPYGLTAFQPPQFVPHLSQTYYNQLAYPQFSSSVKGTTNKTEETDESESDSESSSGGAEERSNRSNSSEQKDL